jgi:dihydrofolate synthase/folylpolyglutamate synthase
LFHICESEKIPATFFEITTALAFEKFRQAKCDAVVLEVGLGGRLDATNIVKPALSVITSIQRDHMNILGNSIQDIAREKAGIMKPGVDVLVGPGCPQDQLKSHAAEVGSPFYTLSLLPPSSRRYNPVHPSTADTDLLNTDLAQASLQLLKKQNHFNHIDLTSSGVTKALLTRPPCRFEEFDLTTDSSKQVKVILDIAHNEGAVKALLSRVKARFPHSEVR